MKRVSQKEETGSGWRERAKGKEEQSVERLGLAKKKKKMQRSQRKEEQKRQRESRLATFERKKLKKKKKESKMTNGC